MKVILTVILLFICFRLAAPQVKEFVILKADKITFDPLLRAFMFVESRFQTDVVNLLGYAGILQEGEEIIAEANRINKLTGNPFRFTSPDRLDSAKAVQVYYTIQNYWNPSYDIKRACKLWNPTAGNWYYELIKSNL